MPILSNLSGIPGVGQVVTAATKTAGDALTKVGLGGVAKALGLTGKKENARGQASLQDTYNAALETDWRVRLSLANSDSVNYLYKDPANKILSPLDATNGIIFPYTPSVSVSYIANYEGSNIQHSNYRIYQYQNSAVEQVTLSCDFTAQDTSEANYVLAVIHFLRSATKMFYGNDANPVAGTPPPLVYLHGLGAYQFDGHPLVITNFQYQLPSDVDYIRAYITSNPGQQPAGGKGTGSIQDSRISSSSTPAAAGGSTPPTDFSQGTGSTVPTWVPTKINIQFSAYPVVSRNDVSNQFSLKAYADGTLLRGSTRKTNKAGMW